MRYLVYTAAVAAALLTVLSTRLVIPALILIYRSIEQSFAPAEEALAETAVVEVAPVKAVAKAAAKPRTTRKRRTTAKSSASTQVATA